MLWSDCLCCGLISSLVFSLLVSRFFILVFFFFLLLLFFSFFLSFSFLLSFSFFLSCLTFLYLILLFFFLLFSYFSLSFTLFFLLFLFCRDPEKLLAFAKEGLGSVIPAYAPLVAKHADDPFTQQQKEWQLMRRGRYVEFNLVYDRGTIFGLKTGGRIESILMSLPETARWEYDHKVAPGSPEEEISKCFKEAREWV